MSANPFDTIPAEAKEALHRLREQARRIAAESHPTDPVQAEIVEHLAAGRPPRQLLAVPEYREALAASLAKALDQWQRAEARSHDDRTA